MKRTKPLSFCVYALRRSFLASGFQMGRHGHLPCCTSSKCSVSTRVVARLHSPQFCRLYSETNHSYGRESSEIENGDQTFRYGDKVQVEIVSFGPLGASVDVIAQGHDPEDLIPESSPPLGQGLIIQKEISYFRQGRNNVDVVLGEVLPAFVERIRDDGKLGIALRVAGGKAKAQEVGQMILERLEWSKDGSLPIGDKSAPQEIAAEFPGVSKSSFKKAVSALFKKGLVKPGPNMISRMK